MIVFEVVEEEGKQPHARIKGGNGEIMFSTETYQGDESAEHAIEVVIEAVKSGNYAVVKNG